MKKSRENICYLITIVILSAILVYTIVSMRDLDKVYYADRFPIYAMAEEHEAEVKYFPDTRSGLCDYLVESRDGWTLYTGNPMLVDN